MAAVAMVKNSDNNKRRPTAAPTMKLAGTVVASGVKPVDTWYNCGCITVALEVTCSTITLWCMQTTWHSNANSQF